MEIDVLKWFHTAFHSQAWLNYIMKYITYIGEFGAAAIACAVLLIIFKKTRWAGIAVACSLILDVLIVNVILKLTVNRARPWTEFEEFKTFYQDFGIRQPTDSSFPSGHTAACFAAAVALTFRYKLKALPALIIAALVALSRIYLCLHYPTDVLGGAIIGVTCGVAGHFMAKFIKHFFDKHFKKPVADGAVLSGGAEEEPVAENTTENAPINKEEDNV